MRSDVGAAQATTYPTGVRGQPRRPWCFWRAVGTPKLVRNRPLCLLRPGRVRTVRRPPRGVPSFGQTLALYLEPLSCSSVLLFSLGSTSVTQWQRRRAAAKKLIRVRNQIRWNATCGLIAARSVIRHRFVYVCSISFLYAGQVRNSVKLPLSTSWSRISTTSR